MKVAVLSDNIKYEEFIRQLLSPWKILFSDPDIADVIVTYNIIKNYGKPTIIIPNKTLEFHRWLKKRNLQVIETQNKKLKVPVNDIIHLTFTPQTQYVWNKTNTSKNSRARANKDILKKIDDINILLPVDIIAEFYLKLIQIYYPRISLIYRFLTGLPIHYSLAPIRIRNILLSAGNINYNCYSDNLPLDALRYLLVWAIQEVAGELTKNNIWKGYKYATLITHDVDSRKGLRRALSLKKIEERYDISSAWFLPTKKYNLNSEIILKLANNSEIGTHGTLHDGKLIHLSQRKIITRLIEAKKTLEKIIKQDVIGFRSPLLQHNYEIIKSVGDAGYYYDTSIPTWEPKHPSTMSPHGIGTVYPFNLNGMLEIPITMTQDHQMRNILGLNISDIAKEWILQKDVIKYLNGLCNLLIHPDYVFSSDKGLLIYEKFLNDIISDKDNIFLLPKDILQIKGRY